MRKKKALLISGGGSWGAFGGGTLARINKKYDTVVGVSTGSLLAPHTALREWELLKLGYTTSHSNYHFDKCWYKGKPLSKKGKFRKLPIIMTLLLGQKSIYTSNALRKRIDKFFPERYFNELIEQNKDVRVGVLNFAENPSKIHYFNSMDETYEDFKDWIWCSASFPFYGSLTKKSWRDSQGNFHVGQWSDAGLGDLIGLRELSGRGYKEIDIVLHRTRTQEKFEGGRVHNLMENIDASIRGMRYDIDFERFYDKIRELNMEETKITIYWLPRKLSNNPIRYDKKEMTAWWEEGYETAFDPDRVEVFEPIKRKF